MHAHRHLLRILPLALVWQAAAAQTLQIVFQNGRSIPASSLVLQGDKLVVKTAEEGFSAGQAFPLAMADHVYGEKPAAIGQAIALALGGKPEDARKLLLPIVNEHRITAKIPGNFWLEAARALLVAQALNGDAADCTAIGKEISDATPVQGIDSFVMLGKALLLPVLTTKWQDRELALRDLASDEMPAELRAYAAYFRGNLFKKENKNAEALEAYLSVPCLHPTGGLILNAAAELQAADLLAAQGRREEALALVHSALRVSQGTILADEANKRVANLK
jgi:tetratricopeptide (TPR) repeat protein